MKPSTDTHERSSFPKLCLAALGVVFGDIGTSPLYAIRECFAHGHDMLLTEANILGVLSLVFYTLLLIITLKYLIFVLRADNGGEGGVLALMTLAIKSVSTNTQRNILMTLGLLGTALLYGDGMITPAISVLSAVEGLQKISPSWEPFVLPMTMLVLTGIFFFQSRGTQKIGMIFGPIILVWFIVLFILGFVNVIDNPQTFYALNPLYAARFLIDHSWSSLPVMGSVFLVATGGEALYADMGHFGKKPIRYCWMFLALPALLMNYFGQGALLLSNPKAVEHPFFNMAPDWFLIPLVLLATLAAIIASQALISGAFSLTNQAIHLGYLPRMFVKYTSSREKGQIYVGNINWMLWICTILFVVEFRTSTSLASAYGIAVSLTMLITTVLMSFVVRNLWKWSSWKVILFVIFFVTVDVVFFYANFLKILEGGWVPLMIAAGIFTLMTTWYRGRRILRKRIIDKTIGLKDLPKIIQEEDVHSIPGCGVFLSGQHISCPPALIQNLRFNKVLHQTTIILTVEIKNVPFIKVKDRVAVKKLSAGIFLVVVKCGYKDTPNVPNALEWAKFQGVPIQDEVSYYLGRETIIPTKNMGMALWRESVFSILSRNSQRATEFFSIPPSQVIEIGIQIEL